MITVLAFFFVANYTLSFIVGLRAAATRARQAAAVPRLGLSVDDRGALVGSIAFLIGAIASDTTNSLIALGALAASYPAFKVFGSVRRDASFHIQSD